MQALTQTNRKFRVLQFSSVWIPRSIGILILPIVFIIWSLIRFGSPWLAISYLKGERLIAQRSLLMLDEGRAGEEREVEFTVRNIGNSPARIVGANYTCACVLTDRLPVSIPGNDTRKLKLKARYQASGNLFQTINYYTDCLTQPILQIQVKGKLVK